MSFKERVVFLDRAALTSDDLPIPSFEHNWSEYPFTEAADLVPRLFWSTTAITHATPINAEAIGQLHKLIRVIVTGPAVVDAAACEAVRLQRKQHLASRVQLFRFHSYVTSVTVRTYAAPTGIIFEVEKQGAIVAELRAPYPTDAALGQDVVAVFSYCSRTREARTLTRAGPSTPVRCDLGWVHAAELQSEEISEGHKDMLEQRFLLTFERLLSSREVAELHDLPPNGYGLWKFNDELRAQGPFPE